MMILSTGALANIAFNLLMIPRLGIEGAAIATLSGYVISDIVCMAVLMRMKLMVLSGKFVATAAVFFGAFLGWRFLLLHHTWTATLLALVVACAIACIYRRDLRELWMIVKTNVRAKGAQENGS